MGERVNVEELERLEREAPTSDVGIAYHNSTRTAPHLEVWDLRTARLMMALYGEASRLLAALRLLESAPPEEDLQAWAEESEADQPTARWLRSVAEWKRANP